MNNVQLSEMSNNKQNPKTKRGKWQVVLHNDVHTTFDYVINTLMDVCGYNEIQAMQCALITHNAQRCVVFIDTHDSCMEIYEMLLDSELNVTLEKHVKKTT